MPLLQVSPAGQGDNKATFLAEFRALRGRAAIDHEELAARAHYPTDIIRNAEAGPELPGLPVLAAYVRACGGDVLEWEERWRRLASEADYDSGLPTRPAGASPAAVAGARAGVTISAAEAHDADRIKAALRAHQEREDLAGRGNVTADQDARPAARMADPHAPAASPATMIANGNHHKKPHPDGFNAWQARTPQTQPAQEPVAPVGEPEVSPLAEPAGTWDSDAQTQAVPRSDVWSRPAPSWTQQPSAPAAEGPRPVYGVADESAWARTTADATAEATGTTTSWSSAAASERSVSHPPVAAIRATSDAASQVTVAQAAAATSARRGGARSGHRALLVLVVLLVIVGCVALLSLT